MWKWFSGKSMREKIEQDPSYIEFLKNAEKFSPVQGVKYGWVEKHSVEEFERLTGFVKSLDQKAEWLIRFFGGGAGLLSLVFAYFLNQRQGDMNDWSLVIHIAPVLILVVFALSIAIRVKSPDLWSDPPNTHKAIVYAEHYSEIEFAVMRGVASQGLKVALEYKGRLLRYAYVCIVVSIVWLVIWSVIISLFSLGV